MEVSQVRMNFCHVSLCPEQKMFSLKVKMNWVTSDCPENEGCVGILAPAPLRVVLSSLWSALGKKEDCWRKALWSTLSRVQQQLNALWKYIKALTGEGSQLAAAAGCAYSPSQPKRRSWQGACRACRVRGKAQTPAVF